jgi:hypothetical protein
MSVLTYEAQVLLVYRLFSITYLLRYHRHKETPEAIKSLILEKIGYEVSRHHFFLATLMISDWKLGPTYCV